MDCQGIPMLCVFQNFILDPHKYDQLIFDKSEQQFNSENSTNGDETTETTQMQKLKIGKPWPMFYTFYKN